MLRANRNPTKVQLAEQPANGSHIQRHVEFSFDPLRQINTPPADHARRLPIRPGLDPCCDCLLLLGRKQGWAARAHVIQQPLQTLGVEAMHPVAQRLPIHATEFGSGRARIAIQHHGYRQGSPGYARILRTNRRRPKLRCGKIRPRHCNCHHPRPHESKFCRHRLISRVGWEPLRSQVFRALV